ncbi:MAG: AraC family transcriptional regulator [Prevotella sp.]|nr:AraC family transcriptional regulator [Prevotella sp.]
MENNLYLCHMYTLKEWWYLAMGSEPYKGWDGKMLCSESNLEKTQKTNVTQGFAACYSFTLVTQGWLRMRYNDRELMIREGDLYIYSPGLAVTILDGSDDYKSICLMVDEFTSLESPTVRDMVSLAYLPLAQLSTPTVRLQPEQTITFERRMREIIGYQQSDNAYKDKLLRMLFAVFMVELQNALELSVTHHHVPPRVEEIFIGFNRLLPEFFLQHRDIRFYADKLCVSDDYLSRIVKRVSGRTVGDYINQMLMLEACYLLHKSNLSIAQISNRLRFSEAAAFTRFFIRMKGMTPKEFRKSSFFI